MTAGRLGAWVHGRTPLEWLALAGGGAVAAYVGWDAALWDPRLQLVLHLIAAAAAVALGLAALRGMPLPRTRLELPILALVAAFALATVTALNNGMSLRAMASVTAYALALPLALVAIRHRPTWVGLLAAVPVLAYAAPTLAALAWRRAEWIVVGAPGLPPLRLPSEGSLFGSVAVPPFVIWPAWALAGLIEDAALRRWLRIALAAVGIPLTILSGSRSAWLAIGVTAAVAGAPWAWHRRGRLRRLIDSPVRAALLAFAALAAGAMAAALVVPRLTAVTSLLYRLDLWRDTLAAWATDPLTGIGPGFMPFARQAAAADFSFPVRQPHSHNLPLGVLGDAGVVGLLAALALVVSIGVVAGPWRARSPLGRSSAVVLLGLAVAGLFEDLTFLPNFNLLAIGLLAVVLLDVGAVRWEPIPRAARRGIAAGLAPAALVIGAAMVTADAGGIAYRAGQDAAADGRWAEATDWLERSAAIDPWHPATPKALAVAAAEAGRPALARSAAETAVARNPGDGLSWTNLAQLCATLEDSGCVASALPRVVATASLGGPELANAAVLADALGETDAADDAYRRSLLTQRLTGLALDWPRPVRVGGGDLEAPVGAVTDLNLVLAWWSVGEPIRIDRLTDPAALAVAHAIGGDLAAAAGWIERATIEAPDEAVTWELAVLLARERGEPTDRLERIAAVARGAPMAAPGEPGRIPRLTFDLAAWRAVPRDGLVPGAVRLLTDPGWPWILRAALP